jgi:transposase
MHKLEERCLSRPPVAANRRPCYEAAGAASFLLAEKLCRPSPIILTPGNGAACAVGR